MTAIVNGFGVAASAAVAASSAAASVSAGAASASAWVPAAAKAHSPKATGSSSEGMPSGAM